MKVDALKYARWIRSQDYFNQFCEQLYDCDNVTFAVIVVILIYTDFDLLLFLHERRVLVV